MSAPLYGKGPADGLHVLKDAWTQKLYLGEQSQCLAGSLAEAIEATYTAAPIRDQGYRLDREETWEIDVTERERLWERSMFLRWSRTNLSPVGNAWYQLVAFQVPLFACQAKHHWGYIDLLGVLLDVRPAL